MGSRRYTDELEDFLADALESHRMYPSDKVWQRISKSIQPSYKWPALTFSAIVIGALYMLTIIFVQPSKDLWHPDYQAPQSSNTSKVVAETLMKNLNSENALVENSILDGTSNDQMVQVPYKAGSVPVSNSLEVATNEEKQYSRLEQLTQHTNESPLVLESIITPAFTFSLPQVYLLPGLQVKNNRSLPNSNEKNISAKSSYVSSTEEDKEIDAFRSNNMILTVAGASSEVSAGAIATTAPLPTASSAVPQLKLQNDLVANEILNIKQIGRKSPWAIRFYATPSVSFRTYFDNKNKSNDLASSSLQGPIAPNWINSASMFVRQQARVGLELGTAVSYDMSRNFRVRIGAQVNYRQFAADAYRGQTEKALILLENNGKVDSLFTITSILNQNGKAETTLTNRFVELAVPLGFDVEVAKGRIGSFYVSGTLQPTYTLYSNGYLLSTDYAHYVNRQDLFKKFNVNTSLEAYLQIPGNGIQWQIGPQIRYQATPGTIEGYGIRQHLVDYGLKVGVMKTLR